MDRPRRSARAPQRYSRASSSTVMSARDADSAGSDLEMTSGGSQLGMVEEDEASDGSLQTDSEADTDDDDFAPAYKKPRKKHVPRSTKPNKAKQGSKKRQKGKLGAFAGLPIDLLLEIASYVEPVTLVALSRTNRVLHQALSAPSAEKVWHAVRKAAGIPATTTGTITARELLLLLFDKKCMMCHKANGAVLDYQLKMRFCKPCQLTNVKPLYSLLTPVQASKGYIAAWGIPATVPVGASAERHVFVPSVLAIKQTIKGFGKNEVALAEATQQRAILVHAAKEDAVKLRHWAEREQQRRSSAVQAAEASREQAIYRKLEDLGYSSDELLPFSGRFLRKQQYEPKISSLIYQPRVLTDAIWRRISPELIAYADEQRSLRLQDERRRRTAEEERQRLWDAGAEERQRVHEQQEQARRAAEVARACAAAEVAKKRRAEEVKLVPALGAHDGKMEELSAAHAGDETSAGYRASLKAYVQADLDAEDSVIASNYACLLAETSVASKITSADLLSVVKIATSLSHDQQASFFSPFVFQLGCRSCFDLKQDQRFFTYFDFRLHKAEAHGYADEPLNMYLQQGRAIGTWVDKSWMWTIEQALKLVGLTAQAGVAEALEKLGAQGRTWKCGWCSQSSAPLHWEEMIQHIFCKHRGATLRLPGVIPLKLAKPFPPPIPPKPEGGPSQVSPPTAGSQKDSTTNAGSSSQAQTLRDGA